MKCKICDKRYHKKCLNVSKSTEITPCVKCVLQILPFCQDTNISVDRSQDAFIESTNIVAFIKSCNTLDNNFNFEDMPFKINSLYTSINEFNDLNLDKKTSFRIMHLNIASLNKYFDDLHNFLCTVKFPFKIIGISEHKIYENKTLNSNLQSFSFIHNTISSSHGGTGIFVSDDLLYKRRGDLEVCSKDKFESLFIEILFPGKKILYAVAFIGILVCL